jgi:signal transduction histidine kinase
MLTPFLVALFVSIIACASVARIARVTTEGRDWLAAALRAIGMAGDVPAIEAALSSHVEIGLDATSVDWWRRADDGSYRVGTRAITGADAAAIDAWVRTGVVWSRHDRLKDGTAPEVDRVLDAMDDGTLAIPLAASGVPFGMLVVGARRRARSYDARAVAEIEAVAAHLVLVAERVQTVALLEESRRMLQQATRLSTVGTLAAELAHEIRNPLVAVQTFLQILPERLDDPEVTVELRAVALTELQRVARLLNELLGMARASVPTFAATDLEIVIEQVVRLLQVSARKKDVVLERLGDVLPVASADASRLKQALVNLVLNAIQASPPGKTVSVLTRTVEETTGRTLVEVAVRDEGPGIAVEDRERVFHPFVTTKESGTGLGLPVTRQIVADHGGSIVIEGERGVGAVFVVRFPLIVPAVERRDTGDVRAA